MLNNFSAFSITGAQFSEVQQTIIVSIKGSSSATTPSLTG